MNVKTCIKIMGKETRSIIFPALLIGVLGPTLLKLLGSAQYLRNYAINVKKNHLKILPVTIGMDLNYLLRKTGYYWEHLLIFLACVYALITLTEFIFDGKRRKKPATFISMGFQMLVCCYLPIVSLIVMRNIYFVNEQWNIKTSSDIRHLSMVVWHNMGVVAKIRLTMHALAFFKKLERGSFEKEALLLLTTPIISSMILPFLTFASLLLAPLNIEKLELDQWLYSEEKKGFNEQLVVVLFEWHDVTAINGHFELNWLCFFGFLASLLWLCSWKETTRANDSSFTSVFHKNMVKLLCLTAPYIMKAALPKFHYVLWADDHVDRSGYTYWWAQIYLNLFTLIARVRLLQHVFSSFRPQN